MRYMVIEHFRDGSASAVYARARERGRMLPEGLVYLDSWVSDDFERCFQVMEADDPGLFELWFAAWRDLVDFEVVPVMSSAQAGAHFSENH